MHLLIQRYRSSIVHYKVLHGGNRLDRFKFYFCFTTHKTTDLKVALSFQYGIIICIKISRQKLTYVIFCNVVYYDRTDQTGYSSNTVGHSHQYTCVFRSDIKMIYIETCETEQPKEYIIINWCAWHKLVYRVKFKWYTAESALVDFKEKSNGSQTNLVKSLEFDMESNFIREIQSLKCGKSNLKNKILLLKNPETVNQN